MYGNYFNPPDPIYRQRLTVEQAGEVAVRRIPGQIINVDMEIDNGVLIYEFIILTAENRIFEVEVAAKNGTILKIEEENDFD